MAILWNSNLMKRQFDENAIWRNTKLMKWQIDKMEKNDNLTKCQIDKKACRWSNKLSNCQLKTLQGYKMETR